MINIIHLSDLHFSNAAKHQDFITEGAIKAFQQYIADPIINSADSILFGQHCSKLARLAADFVLRTLPSHDAIIISGDLATRGRNEDLTEARSYIFDASIKGQGALTREGKPTLSINTKPIHVLPGNHDRFHGFTGLPGCRNFDAIFRNFWEPELQIDVREITAESGEKVFVLFADFCLHATTHASSEHPFNVWGQGTCLPSTIREVVRITMQLRDKYKQHGFIWVSHFVPDSALYIPEVTIQLNQGNELLEAADYCGVRYIMCGHVHEPVMVDLQHSSLLIAGSPTLNGSKYGNWIHSLSFDLTGSNLRLIDRQDYCFDSSQKEFVLARISHIKA